MKVTFPKLNKLTRVISI